MSATKAIVVVGEDGIEKVHILHRKGESDQAVWFYENLIPALAEVEQRAKNIPAGANGDPWKQVAQRA